jgi:hypothetical protein
MKLYHASLSLNILKRYNKVFGTKLNVLLSRAYNEQESDGFLIKFRYMLNSLIGDSGAWSVAKKTSNLTVEALIAHLAKWGHLYDLYFNFDTDFSDKGFYNNIVNQLKMETAGLKPVPVVHNFFDREITYYIQSGQYDWLALGSSQSKNYDDFRYAVDRIKTWGNPKIKIHWFGGSKFNWLINTPIASCDTTSWAATGAHGDIIYWNDNYDGVYKMNKIYICGQIKEESGDEAGRQFHFVEYPWRNELEEYLFKTFSLTYGDLCGYNGYENMQLINVRYFTELERRINEERIRRGVELE